MFSGSLKLSVLTCFMALSLVEGKITDKCMDCLAKVEDGTSGVCEVDKGAEYCGVYKLSKPFWIDCHMPTVSGAKHSGPDEDKSYKECSSDDACARGCITAYMSRYAFLCQEDLGGKAELSCEDYGRMHNGGGPSGCAQTHTLTYYVEQLMRTRCQLELGITPTTASPTPSSDQLNVTSSTLDLQPLNPSNVSDSQTQQPLDTLETTTATLPTTIGNILP